MHPPNLDIKCFHFHSVKNTFDLPCCYFFDSGLFRSILFSFQMFGMFQEDLSVIDFKFNTIVVWKYTLYDLNHFKFIDTCFMAQNMVYIFLLCALEKKVYFATDWVECSISIRPV